MKKTIKLYKDCELTLSNNAGWLYEYREQFGHDIVPDIMMAECGRHERHAERQRAGVHRL